MNDINALLTNAAASLDPARKLAELHMLHGESIGWQALANDAYLHIGAPDDDAPVIEVVGIPDAQMAGGNYLLLL